MKVLIAGSRGINDPALLLDAVEKAQFEISELICGMAHGVDLMAYHLAEELNIPIRKYPAEWDRYGKAAGMIRNQKMVEEADAAIFLQLDQSRGTQNSIVLAADKGIPLLVFEYTKARNGSLLETRSYKQNIHVLQAA